MLENTDGAITNEQSRETGNIGYTRQKMKTKQTHNTICVRHRYTQTKKIKVNITWPSHKQLEVKTNRTITFACHCFFMCLYQA